MNSPLESLLSKLAADLRARGEDGLLRALEPASGIDFASNDYLALSGHPRLRERMIAALEEGPVGAPASRLLRGDLPVHRRAEEEFARFKGMEAALLFPSGYHANLGLLSALVQPEDRALSDALNHASIIDGLRLCRCRKEIYPHRDLDALERLLDAPHPGGRTFVVTESLFSMDGDIAPLDRIAAIAARRGAVLIADEAHATGLFGEARGSGLIEAFGVEREVLAAVSTGGKALGLGGAFVTGPRKVIDHLVNHARAFIYTTAPLPVLAAGIAAALEVIAAEPWRRARALENAARLRAGLRSRGLEVPDGGGPIVPVILGGGALALRISRAVRERGYDVRALRPPSVPEGTSRLRLSAHADHTAGAIDGAVEAIADSMQGAPRAGGRG